jgi:hypothetical protein
MRTLSLLLVCSFALMHTSCGQKSDRTSPPATAEVLKGDFKASINYGQPSKNGRLIFGTNEDDALVPFGEPWRTGANEATEITISKAVSINGKTLDAGTYSIYTIPGESEWVIAFNSETDYWGRSLFGSAFKKEKDVFRINVTPKTSESVTETFTISMKEVSEASVIVTMAWDQTSVAFEMMF